MECEVVWVTCETPTVFCLMISCSHVGGWQRFTATLCFHRQEAVSYSETLGNTYEAIRCHNSEPHSRIFLPWNPQISFLWIIKCKRKQRNVISNVHSIKYRLIVLDLIVVIMSGSRSRWPRGLRLGAAAACLLGLRVRIPLVAWTSVFLWLLCVMW